MEPMKNTLLTIFALVLIAPTFAAAQAAPAAPSTMDALYRSLPMFAGVFLISYFLIIRPQQKKLVDQQNLLSSLKKGDEVVTSGGLIGRVAAIEGAIVTLELGGGAKVRVETAHIARLFVVPEKAKAA